MRGDILITLFSPERESGFNPYKPAFAGGMGTFSRAPDRMKKGVAFEPVPFMPKLVA